MRRGEERPVRGRRGDAGGADGKRRAAAPIVGAAASRAPAAGKRPLPPLTALASVYDAGEACRLAVRCVTGLFPRAAAGIYLSRRDDEDGLELVACSGIDEDFARRYETRGRLETERNELLRDVLASGRTVVVRDVASDERVRNRKEIAGRGLRASAIVPLVVAGRAMGVLAAARRDGHEFGAPAVAALEEIGRQVAVAVSHARLFEEASQRVRDLSVLNKASAELVGTLALRPLDERVARSMARIVDLPGWLLRHVETILVVARSMARLLDVPQCFVMLHDPAARVLRGLGIVAPDTNVPRPVRIRLDETALAVRAFHERRPIVVEDAWRDPGVCKRLVRLFDEKSLVAIPLVVSDRAIGCIVLAETRRIRRFTEAEVERAMTVANQAAMAIEGARLFAEAKAKRERAELFLDTVRVCGSSLDLGNVLGRVAERMAGVTGAECCMLLLPDPSLKRIAEIVDHGTPPRLRARVRALRGAPLAGDALVARLFAATAPLALPARKRRGRGPLGQLLESEGALLVPVRSKGRLVAAIVLIFAERRGRAFEAEELALVQGVADQVAMAVANARAYDEIGQQKAALADLSSRILQAREQERHRLARELHDGVSQTLTAAKLVLERLAREVEAGKSAEVTDAAKIVVESIRELRRLCMDLRPSQLDHLGLVPTLVGFAKVFGERTGLEIDVRADDEIRTTPDMEINLYRIAQEALTNVVKHARARRAWLTLRRLDDSVELRVADDGRGLPPETVPKGPGPRGLGLLTMAERARLLGGELRIEPRKGGGTCVVASVPPAPVSPAPVPPAAARAEARAPAPDRPS